MRCDACGKPATHFGCAHKNQSDRASCDECACDYCQPLAREEQPSDAARLAEALDVVRDLLARDAKTWKCTQCDRVATNVVSGQFGRYPSNVCEDHVSDTPRVWLNELPEEIRRALALLGAAK